MECPYREGKRCTLVEDYLIYQPVPTTPEICRACLKHEKRLNYITLSLASRTSERQLIPLPPTTKGTIGTQLESIFGTIFQKLPDCRCPGHRDILDTWTPEYIKSNMSHVIRWLEREAKIRKIPFSRTLARTLLNLVLYHQG
jgi:hypothetical protein